MDLQDMARRLSSANTALMPPARWGASRIGDWQRELETGMFVVSGLAKEGGEGSVEDVGVGMEEERRREVSGWTGTKMESNRYVCVYVGR